MALLPVPFNAESLEVLSEARRRLAIAAVDEENVGPPAGLQLLEIESAEIGQRLLGQPVTGGDEAAWGAGAFR